MPYGTLDDFEIYRQAERISDRFYTLVRQWDPFARDTLGSQLVRAADSVGANVAESYGRFHYGERIQFLYYARGSIYETVYWVRRARSRKLLPDETCAVALRMLDDLAAQLNAYIRQTKQKRAGGEAGGARVAETNAPYERDEPEQESADSVDALLRIMLSQPPSDPTASEYPVN